MLYAHPCVFMQYICKIRPISRMENFYITTIVLIIVFVFPSFLLQYVSCFAGSDIEKWDIIGRFLSQILQRGAKTTPAIGTRCWGECV